MIQTVPRYDELYVVSDIHMGGRPGFQILNQGARLGEFIETIAKRRPKDNVTLLMNGDIIDSLAEDEVVVRRSSAARRRTLERMGHNPDGLPLCARIPMSSKQGC